MSSAPLILLLADSFSLRGTSAYTLRLARHLPASESRVKVVCPDGQLLSTDAKRELFVVEYPYLLSPLWGCVTRRWLRRDLLNDPPALIHVQSRSMLRLGMWLAKRIGCPLVLTMHDFLARNERLPFQTTWGRRVIAVSEPVREALIQQAKLPPNLIDVIPSGVEECNQPLQPVLDPHRTPVIGTAGPLEVVKGLPFFLGAAQQVLAAGAVAEFVVVGAGPEEVNLRRLSRELGIAGQVTFVPNVLDLKGSLSAMDMFCLPSLRQGLGTIMLEAMALGRPVIATSVDGVNSVVKDDETGLLVTPGNSGELARRMLELLRDPFRARRIAEAGRDLVRREFGVDRMAQQTLAVYRQVLAE